YPCARGLTTSPMREGDTEFEMCFDFVDHVLRIDFHDGRTKELPLVAEPVSSFHARFTAALTELGIGVKIWPVPVEVPEPVAFPADGQGEYDPEYARRFARVLLSTQDVLRR